MAILRTGLYPTNRLRSGAAILAAGDTVDVSVVRKRFDAFAAEHYAYTGAHGTVQAALATLRQRQAVLDKHDINQDEALEGLAKRLVADGHTRANPFAAFGVAAPSAVMDLNFGEKAAAIHTLVGMLQADTTLTAATHRAARAAEAAANSMEADLVPFEKLQTALRTARTARQTAGKKWDKAFIALKLDARAADAEGGLGLEEALLGHLNHSKKATQNKPHATGGTQPTAGGTPETADKVATPATAPLITTAA